MSPWVSAVPNRPVSSIPVSNHITFCADASTSSEMTSASNCSRSNCRRLWPSDNGSSTSKASTLPSCVADVTVPAVALSMRNAATSRSSRGCA
ncbi:hypothetical protein D3C81_1556600 [compost metagenome]